MKSACCQHDASVNTILMIVPQMDRVIFRLHRYYGIPERDIAIIFNTSEESVKNRIAGIQNTIREFLA